jgi:hypothetical protein
MGVEGLKKGEWGRGLKEQNFKDPMLKSEIMKALKEFVISVSNIEFITHCKKYFKKY